MSVSAEEEVSLRIAVAIELDDVTPRDGLAALVIDRYRRALRRRIAGAVGLAVAFAGIGVPLGLTASGSGGAPSGAVVLRLGGYALRLPGAYRATSAPCASAASAARVPSVAAASASGCVVMRLTVEAIPPGARKVAAGHYQAWAVQDGLVVEGTPDLMISASGVSDEALAALVGAGLTS